MNKKSFVNALMIVSLMTSICLAASPKDKNSGARDRVLNSGKYTGKAGAFVCGGCGPAIEETLKKDPNIESVSVNSKTNMVQFTVKKRAKVKLSDLQKELKASADQMGMGADYQLNNVKEKKN